MFTKMLENLGIRRLILEEYLPNSPIKKSIKNGTFCQFKKPLLKYMIFNFLLKKYDYRCAYCQKEDVEFNIDHKVPKSCGGGSELHNLVLSCIECNKRKKDLSCEIFGIPRSGKSIINNQVLFPYNMIRFKLKNGGKSLYGMRKNDYIREGFSFIKMENKKYLIYTSSRKYSITDVYCLKRHKVILFRRKI